MLHNYIKVAIRNLTRYRVFSIINISGLAIGLACCLVITLYIKEELSYDRFHENSDKIYRVTRDFFSPDGSTTLRLARVAPPVGPLFKNDFAEEIDIIGRMVFFGGTIEYEDKLFNEPDVAFADNEILQIFSFNFIHGNPETALLESGSMVITDVIATKYFGRTDVVGKVLRFSGEMNFKVTGVIEEFPNNSHFDVGLIGDFGVIESYYGGRENLMGNWGSNNFATYFILNDGYSVQAIADRVPDFLISHIAEDAPTWTNLQFMKLTDIHLHSHLDDEMKENGDIKYVYSFAGIAVLILLIAGINYMNLTTARSASRAKEVGMRKVLGAVRNNLINQFLAESILLVMLSVIVSVVLASLALPFLRDLTGNSFSFSFWHDLPLVSAVLIFSVAIGVLAGSYPAFYLSAFQPVQVLKGKLRAGAKGLALRKGLVVIQFSISVILIVSTVLIFQQIQYMQTKDLGFNKNHILILNSSEELGENFKTFKTELLKHSGIRKVAGSRRIPSGRLLDSGGAEAQVGNEMITPTLVIKDLPVDYDFIDTYEMQIVSGRAFSKNFATDDTAAYVINQAAVKSVGWANPEESLDKDFAYRGNKGKIVGVVKDSHFESLHNQIAPLVMYINESQTRYYSIRINSSDIRETVAHIEKVYAQFSPTTPIDYNFLDDRFNELYRNEMVRSKLYSGFSFLAIFLACLGVFGLASFTTSQRGKEISIRKVLGATITQIVFLLSNEFLVLVVISFGIAFPVVYYFMNSWLQNFAYQISIELWPFFGAGALALGIAMGTISLQTIKAALGNPVDALRNE